MGWMMAGMLTQLPLPLLPAGAEEIAPGVGLVTGEDGGGLVSVHGLATFAWDAGDEAGRRLAAVQLVRLRAVSQVQAAAAFGVDPVTVWRWDQALAAGGVAGLVPARRGPKGASKLTAELAARIRDLDAAGARLGEVAAATGVSAFSVRNALGRVPARGQAGTAAGSAGRPADDDDAGQSAVPVLPDPVPRDGERALARWRLLGEGAVPVFTAGARYPLAGLLLALPRRSPGHHPRSRTPDRPAPGPGHGPRSAASPAPAIARRSGRSCRPGAAAAPARHATRPPDPLPETSRPRDHPVTLLT
jgi:transposase-like protein